MRRVDERGQAGLTGLLNVFLWFFGFLFAMWMFYLIATGVLEPIREVVLSFDTVQDRGHASAVNNFWSILVIWAPVLFFSGATLLIIIFSVWREQFLGRGVRRP